jgi:hypothetical protein
MYNLYYIHDQPESVSESSEVFPSIEDGTKLIIVKTKCLVKSDLISPNIFVRPLDQ